MPTTLGNPDNQSLHSFHLPINKEGSLRRLTCYPLSSISSRWKLFKSVSHVPPNGVGQGTPLTKRLQMDPSHQTVLTETCQKSTVITA